MQKLAKFDCYVGTLNGKLHSAHLVNGWPKFIAGNINWIEVDSSVTQDFLDAANLSLKTDYRLSDLLEKNRPSKLSAGYRDGMQPKSAELRPGN